MRRQAGRFLAQLTALELGQLRPERLPLRAGGRSPGPREGQGPATGHHIRRAIDPSALGCRRRRLAKPLPPQSGSWTGRAGSAFRTSISASPAASASSTNR